MKQPGESAHLYYDPDDQVDVEEGDYLRTGTGRLYLITGVRVQESGKHAGRYHLDCVVMERHHLTEPDAAVHTVVWYPRGETRRSKT